MRIKQYTFIVINFFINAKAASSTKPHPHEGKTKPFQPGNPNITLDKNAIKVLQSEQPYQVKLYYLKINKINHYQRLK